MKSTAFHAEVFKTTFLIMLKNWKTHTSPSQAASRVIQHHSIVQQAPQFLKQVFSLVQKNIEVNEMARKLKLSHDSHYSQSREETFTRIEKQIAEDLVLSRGPLSPAEKTALHEIFEMTRKRLGIGSTQNKALN